MDWENEEDRLRFVRNLTRKWRTPAMKNITDRITMIRRSAGLILKPDEEDGDGFGVLDSHIGKLKTMNMPFMSLTN